MVENIIESIKIIKINSATFLVIFLNIIYYHNLNFIFINIILLNNNIL